MPQRHNGCTPDTTVEKYVRDPRSQVKGKKNDAAESYRYFHNVLFNVVEGECLFDIGAFDGCSTYSFIDACRQRAINDYTKYAFEPDPTNFRKLQKNMVQEPNIHLVNKAVGRDVSTIKFSSLEMRTALNAINSPASSKIDSDGDIIADVCSIDSISNEIPCTLIKSDPPTKEAIIEVIDGARDTFRRLRPIFITGAYHDATAVLDIPLKFIEMDLRISVFFRHLSWHFNETHFFCMPNERLK